MPIPSRKESELWEEEVKDVLKIIITIITLIIMIYTLTYNGPQKWVAGSLFGFSASLGLYVLSGNKNVQKT